MTVTEWERLRHHLLQMTRVKAIEHADDRDAAAFALYAAEWFRREFEGGAYRWEALLESIGGLAPEITARLARRGLKWWGRSAHRTDHGEQRLMSLALEGGFPTRLLDSREQGWLSGALRRLIARAAVLGDQSLEAAVELAVAEPAIPQTFRKPEFFTLLAELALAIVELRANSARDATAAGVSTSAWLDARREGWRDELPIALEGEGAGKLIDDLVSQSLERLGGSGARCWRMLVRRDGLWAPALKLAFDGEIRVPTAVRAMSSRLRLHAIGDLGDRLAGELALLDPPGDDGAWVARPRPAAPRRPLRNYAFSSAVEVELRSDGQRVAAFTWSSAGEPVHGEVFAFVDEQELEEGSAEALAFLGSGSQRARHRLIYVWAPADHEAKALNGTAIPSLWGDQTHRLFCLNEPAYVSGPEDDLAFFYEPNTAAGKAESLDFAGEAYHGVACVAGRPVFRGAPVVSLLSGVAKNAFGFGQVMWRYEGEHRWRDLKRERLGFGRIEVVWRASETRTARDRRRLIVLPPDLQVRSRAGAQGAAEFWLEGAEGWRLELDVSQAYGLERLERGVRVKWSIDRRNAIDLQLISPEGRSARVTTRFPLGDGALVGANGSVLGGDAVLTLKQLRGARAVARGKGKLAIETTDRDNRTVYHQVFDDECSLWSLRDRIAALMEASGNLDAEVRVAFEPNGPALRVRRYEHALEVARGIVRLRKPTEGDGRPLFFEWRSLIDLSENGRRLVASMSVADAMSMRPFSLPEDLIGPGLVYLRQGEAIVSRPHFVHGAPIDGQDLNRLQTAVVQDRSSFKPALDAAFAAIEGGGAAADVELQWLHQLAKLAATLPATTFDVLKHLGRRSRILAHLIASSPNEEALERVWALEPELPFLWVLVSLDDWRHAFAEQYQRTWRALRGLGWEEVKAHATAAAQINTLLDKLLLLDDDLRAPMAAAGLRARDAQPLRSPREIGQDRIRRLAGSEQGPRRSSCFMADPDLRAELLSLADWFQSFHEDQWEGVQAPLVAALRAAGKVTLLPLHRLRIREAMLEDPEHFAEAYEACLLSLSNLSPVEVAQ